MLIFNGELKKIVKEECHIRKGSSSIYARITISKASSHPGVQDYAIMIMEDISEQKKAYAKVERETERAKLLLEIYMKAPEMSDDELYAYALDKAVFLTGSAIGFFHLVSEDQKAIKLTTWNSEALKNCTAAYDDHYPLESAGNWVDCIRKKVR